MEEKKEEEIKKQGSLWKWPAVIFLLGVIGLGLLYFQIPTKLIAKSYPVQGISAGAYHFFSFDSPGVTQPFYQRFLEGYYEDYPLRIRGVYLPPMQENAVWQYSDLLQLNGMSGEEKYVDGDVCWELGQIMR